MMFSFSYRNAESCVGTCYKTFLTNQKKENVKDRLHQILDRFRKMKISIDK